MTEKTVFDNRFHMRYVGGQGVVVDKEPYEFPKNEVRSQTYDEILAEYRRYVNDSGAELPEEIMEELRIQGKV